MQNLNKTELELDGWVYRLAIRRCGPDAPPEVPRLIIPAYQPNASARRLLEMCLRTIAHCTGDTPYELWVVDNHSPKAHAAWLHTWPGLNVIFNQTEPRPREERTAIRRLRWWRDQKAWGSYANALGLEIALRYIDSNARYIMPLHMDTVACRTGWLSFLREKLDSSTGAVGFFSVHHRVPEGVLHVSGYLADYPLMKRLQVDFWPQLPAYDVGDRLTPVLRSAGYHVYTCRNTYESEGLADELLPPESPYHAIRVARAFDDEGRVIFMHLGRGIPKAGAYYRGQAASAVEWTAFVEQNILAHPV